MFAAVQNNVLDPASLVELNPFSTRLNGLRTVFQRNHVKAILRETLYLRAIQIACIWTKLAEADATVQMLLLITEVMRANDIEQRVFTRLYRAGMRVTEEAAKLA